MTFYGALHIIDIQIMLLPPLFALVLPLHTLDQEHFLPAVAYEVETSGF